MTQRTCICGETFEDPEHRGPPRRWCEKCRRNWNRRKRAQVGDPRPYARARYCPCGRRMVRSRIDGKQYDRCSRCRDVRRREKGVFVPLPPIDWSKVRRVLV